MFKSLEDGTGFQSLNSDAAVVVPGGYVQQNRTNDELKFVCFQILKEKGQLLLYYEYRPSPSDRTGVRIIIFAILALPTTNDIVLEGLMLTE